MRRLVGFLVHNWPLKLAAVILATLLYAGLVLSQSARAWPGPISIQVIHQPPSAFIVGTLPDVTNVRYFAPVDVADRVSSAAFAATVDLADADPTASEPFLVPVHLQGPDGVNIIDYTPREIYVRLDPLVTRTVPVTVDHGTVPEGLKLGETTVSQSTATVSGPESVVNQVVAAEARVQIQSSGIDVDQLVDLVPVDGRGEVLSPVELNPTSVRVSIPVGSPVGTKSVPVTALVTGSPGAGYEVATTTITPPVATVTGEASTLAGLTSLETQPVDVSGATTTVTRTVGLNLPEGIAQIGDQTFDVSVTVRVTEATRTLSAGLILVGAAPDRTYALAVDSVTVTLGGGQQMLDGIDAASFAASVNVAGLGAGSHDVEVRVVPSGDLRVVAVSPDHVTVFVGEAATPPPATPSPSPTASPPSSAEPSATESAPALPSAEASPGPSESPSATPAGSP